MQTCVYSTDHFFGESIPMKTQNKTLGRLLLMLMIGLFGTTAAWSQEESLEAQLNLTAQQKEQINDLKSTFKKEAAPIKARIKQLQAERSRLEAAKASNEAISEVLNQKAAEEIKLAMLLRDFKQNYLKILTPEQLKLLQALKKGS